MVIDAVRIIDGTNTQTRKLKIASFILSTLNRHTLTTKIIENQAITWSKDLEKINLKYRKSSGKLTENNKPTTAFKHYIDFLVDLKLISKINEVIRCSKYGLIYNLLKMKLEHFDDSGFELLDFEILFYTYFLFLEDFDSLVILIKIILESDTALQEKEIRSKYGMEMWNRFEVKSFSSTGIARSESERIFRKYIQLKTNSGRSAFKHHVPNRLTWLIDLGFIFKSGKFFYCTKKGQKLYSNLIIINGSSFLDINREWLNNNLWLLFTELSAGQIITGEELGGLLTEYFNFFGDDGSFRISLHPAFVFLAIYFACSKRVVLTLGEFKKLLASNKVKTKTRIFSFKEGPRITESYINILTR